MINDDSKNMAAHVIRNKMIRVNYELGIVSAAVCGNCQYWMTKSCKPEAEQGIKKTMNTLGCNNFKREELTDAQVDDLKTDLIQLRLELSEVE